MVRYRPVLALLGMVFILSVIAMGIVKIWNPELIQNEIFEKIILTFVLLAVGSVSVLFLSGFKNLPPPDKKD
jgi:hypothetical protein